MKAVNPSYISSEVTGLRFVPVHIFTNENLPEFIFTIQFHSDDFFRDECY